MAIFDSIRIGSSNPSGGYEIEQSLRFDRNSSAYLSRTAGSPTNSQKGTWSCWMKRTKNDASTLLYGGGGGSQTNSNAEQLAYMSSSDVIASNYKGGLGGCSVGWYMYGTRKIRDEAAWYHILVSFDWTASGDSNRLKFYINGVQDTLNSCGGTGNGFQYVNINGATQYMGRQDQGGGPGYSDHYLAEAYFVDGTVYTPSDFTETDSETGVIVPLSSDSVLAAITLGNNGGYYNFSDTSDLGKDHSSNSNDFTSHNFEVSGGVGHDVLFDSPTNNFPTFSALNTPVNSSFNEGNLLMRGGDNFASSTFLLPKSGKWYAEFTKYNNGAPQSISVTRANTAMTNYSGALGLADNVEYVSNGELGNRSRGSTSDATVWENDANITVAIAVDMDHGAVYFARANSWQNSGNPTSGASKTGAMGTDLLTDNNGEHYIAAHGYNGNSSFGMYVNFGQRAFTYTPPTGYQALCSANLPDPTVKLPTKHFETRLYSGSPNGQSGFEFSPDWVWIKGRNFNVFHGLYDTVRGAGKILHSNNTNEQSSYNSTLLSAFTSDGYTFGSNTDVQGGGNYVAWNWSAGDSTVSNSNGSITSQVRANTTAGFSIVTYTGTGSSTTVGHGLGVKPSAIIIKCTSNADNWMVYHHRSNEGSSPEDYYFELNATGGRINSTVMLNDTAPTSSVVTIGSDNSVNGSGRTYVMYCFNEVEGYSKFGGYHGNGSSNGRYVYTGFKPAYFMTIGNSHGSNRYVWDTETEFNPQNSPKQANDQGTESGSYDNSFDILSNGFKARASDAGSNGSGRYYVYFAFAKAPVKYSRAR